MNTAWGAIQLFQAGNSFLHIEGKVTLNVSNIDQALLKRTQQAIKRGFGTATQGPTHKLLVLLAKSTGYSDYGYPHVGYSEVVMYFPQAAANDYKDVSDTIQSLMHLEGSARQYSHRNEQNLLFTQHASGMTGDQRKRLRKFIKEQSLRWMIFRQPMLDFLDDKDRSIVWEFDSTYKGESK